MMLEWLTRFLSKRVLATQPATPKDRRVDDAMVRYRELERRQQLLLDEDEARHSGLAKGR